MAALAAFAPFTAFAAFTPPAAPPAPATALFSPPALSPAATVPRIAPADLEIPLATSPTISPAVETSFGARTLMVDYTEAAVNNFGRQQEMGSKLWMAALTYESMGKAMVLAQKSEVMIRADFVKYIFFQLGIGDLI
ncbi:hypothetical protein DID88_007369 [Monilinia fructigena]|uniref:Uncharacterized protein n=1 Tax=Monilinia fructigena TaxID=38457 RepID=A0A395J883_9HELO|nr:hypothetical protein DID88_007369 [Monilinia fructigena]